MIPIPQYPLYSATIASTAENRSATSWMKRTSWQLNEQILTESLAQRDGRGIRPVADRRHQPRQPHGRGSLEREHPDVIDVSPGGIGWRLSPTKCIRRMCTHRNRRFHSFAKVMHEMGETERVALQPALGLERISGGVRTPGRLFGDPERPDDVLAQFIKLQSISSARTSPGQFATYLMVEPPLQVTRAMRHTCASATRSCRL